MNAKAYNKTKLKIWLIQTILNLFLLILFIFSGANVFLYGWVANSFTNPYIQFISYMLCTGIFAGIFFFPFNFYSGYLLEKKYNLSEQSLTAWFIESGKGLILTIMLGIPLLISFFYLLRNYPDTWWFWFGSLIFIFSVGLAVIFPVIILPLFYKQKPIEEPELTSMIQKIVSKAGLKIKFISEFNLSKTTKKGNAMLAGMGKTKRVLIGDTLLQSFTVNEIETILAHELGHSHHKHIIKNVFIGTLQSYFMYWLMSVVYAKFVTMAGFRHVAEIPALPILALAAMIFGILQSPVFTYISRRFEYQADAYGIKLSGKPDVFITALEKLTEQNLGDREPHPFVEWYMYSHPSVNNRIKAVKSL